MLSHRSLRRVALAAVLFSSIALAHPVSAVASGPYRQQITRPHHAGFFGTLWGVMSALWGGEGTTTDPNGRPR